MYKCMRAPILHRDLWPAVGHLFHTIATRGVYTGSTIKPQIKAGVDISNYPPSILQCHLSIRVDI